MTTTPASPVRPREIFFLRAFLVSLILFLSSCQKDSGPSDKRIREMDPKETAQLAKTIEAQVTPQIADGLTLRLWGVDSLVADPVSIDLDDQGTLYYTRTNRQKN